MANPEFFAFLPYAYFPCLIFFMNRPTENRQHKKLWLESPNGSFKQM